jgi:hypothetical protein
MSIAAATYSPPINAAILSGGQFLRPSASTISPVRPASQDLRRQAEVPDFNLHFGGTLINIENSIDYREVIIESSIAAGVSSILTLKNEPVKGAANYLRVKEVSLNLNVLEHRSRAHFITASLYAALSLAESVNISVPEVNLDVRVRFNIPLSEISKLLQQRQTYFGLLVIERATGLEFGIPEYIPGADLHAIAFAYHAIVAREFVWLANDVTVQMPVTEERLAWVNDPRNMKVSNFDFGPDPTSRTILGQTVALGDQTVLIEDGVIQNREEVKRELSRLDGHIVPVKIRPLSRKGRYRLPNAPRLPSAPWDEEIEAYINLEDQLNERLTARYNELAASTLAGLSSEEIEAVTAQPVLDENAHLISD